MENERANSSKIESNNWVRFLNKKQSDHVFNLEEKLLVKTGEIKALERIALARDEERQKKRKISELCESQ